MNVIPSGSLIAVRKDEAPKQTASGLYLGAADERVVTGVVVAVGPGRYTDSGTLIPVWFKPNDKVIFDKTLAKEVKVNEETFYFLRDDQSLGKFEQ